MFRYHQISPNISTQEVIEYLLSLQKSKHWKLGKCEFIRYFQYSWENENDLVDAIFSVPRIFDEEYRWEFDTQSYPWTINLVKTKNYPTCRVREGHNLKGFTVKSNPNQLINRIYPLGQGEGVNQLNIVKVNPSGKEYVEDRNSIEKYGLVEYIWPDKRFTDDRTLYTSSVALLLKFKQPIVEWSVDAIDLIKAIPQRPGQIIPKVDTLREGKVVQVITEKYGKLNLRILKASKSDMFGSGKGNIQLTIGYVPSDLGTTQSDIERNIQINQLYSQGATNILNYDKSDNADPSSPVKFSIFIDDDVVKINTCELTFTTAAFRAYSKAIEGGGALVSSTKGGGGIIKATSAGGYTSKSTKGGGASVQSTTSEAAGQSTQTSSANRSHRHRMFRMPGNARKEEGDIYTDMVALSSATGTEVAVGVKFINATTEICTDGAADDHSHSVSTPAHTHRVDVDIPQHFHEFEVPEHTHEIDLPNHGHEIELPNHIHQIEYSIFESKNKANQVEIKVDNNMVAGTETSRTRFNLILFLSKSEDGTIQKGWHTIEMIPNDLARIEAQITMRVFIKSQLGGDF